ncbi:MAG: hypothetical protein IJL91_06275 [Bacteroidales bacterium]|nr:hypothetical protein [Bacteroidales bacterium]
MIKKEKFELEAYVAPECETLEIKSEGVISLSNGIEESEEDDWGILESILGE